MKQPINYFFAFMCFICFANGQGQKQISTMFPERSGEHTGEPIQMNQTKKDYFPVINKQGELFNTKSLRWDWDTIFTFDTVGLLARLTRTYENGNVMIQFSSHLENNIWVISGRRTFTYSTNGNMLTDLYEYYQNNVWVNSWRNTFTYDANGNMLTDLYEHWNNNEWENSLKDSYTYDGSGNILTWLDEQWLNNSWVNDSKETYTYDGTGNMLTSLIEDWLINAWVNSYKDTYTYDINGNWVARLSEDWQNSAWLNSQRSTITYDGSGNMLTFLYENWQTNTWANSNRFTFTYDVNGNMLTYIFELWQANEWKNSNRFTYTYDANGNSITGKCDIWQFASWQPGISNYFSIEVYSQKQYIYSLVSIHRFEAIFTSFINAITENTDNKFRISVTPNPATERITVESQFFKENKGGMISIYNIQGQSVLQRPLLQEKPEINISTLAYGIYILKLYSGEKAEVTRFVKE